MDKSSLCLDLPNFTSIFLREGWKWHPFYTQKGIKRYNGQPDPCGHALIINITLRMIKSIKYNTYALILFSKLQWRF